MALIPQQHIHQTETHSGATYVSSAVGPSAVADLRSCLIVPARCDLIEEFKAYCAAAFIC